jgi:hypothetical protein
MSTSPGWIASKPAGSGSGLAGTSRPTPHLQHRLQPDDDQVDGVTPPAVRVGELNQKSGRPDDPLTTDKMRRIESERREARADVDRDETWAREVRHRGDRWSLRQFRARGWTGAVLVALFGGLATLVPYYSALVLLGTVATTVATLVAWLLISLRGRRYTPPLSVHLSSLVFIFVAFALLSISVGANRPGSGVGALLLGLGGVTLTAAAVVGWLWPSRRLHDGPVIGAVLAAVVCLAAFLRLLPVVFVTRYLVAVVGLIIFAATGYSWLAFVKRWRTGAAPP